MNRISRFSFFFHSWKLKIDSWRKTKKKSEASSNDRGREETLNKDFFWIFVQAIFFIARRRLSHGSEQAASKALEASEEKVIKQEINEIRCKELNGRWSTKRREPIRKSISNNTARFFFIEKSIKKRVESKRGRERDGEEFYYGSSLMFN